MDMMQLERELASLISQYNQLKNTYLLVYASATEKMLQEASLSQSDFYMIHDLLNNKSHHNNVDVYIETRGGSGEAAEEIVRFLHKKFKTVSFIVSGEAKSAGTITVLSGDEIFMTDTGSLGPIDAQIKIGRSIVSASDYIDWVDDKRTEAECSGTLNPFDAKMIAQITPGELGSALHSLKFAEDLVEEWLVKFKFKNWKVTEQSKKQVTEEYKKQRAREIAQKLTKHSKWRSHGRSIKIEDLREIGLKINQVEDDPKLANVVYRIQTVSRFLFDHTSTYKIFATSENRIFKQAVAIKAPIQQAIPIKGGKFAKMPDVVAIQPQCPKCGITHKIYAKFVSDPKIDIDAQKKGLTPFPSSGIIKCSCGFSIDLLGIKAQV
jgi:hypothetical protein